MPTKVEKDSVTGTETTGHEWDGLKELNTPLPTWWVYILYATIVWAIGYSIVYPSWPWFNGYIKGMWGYSQRVELDTRLAAAAEQRGAFLAKIKADSLDQIQRNPELFNFALAGGRVAFGDNCAPCHGAGGAGAKGYPSLADDDWLWGGDIANIYQTVSFGVRNANDKSRNNQMPRFGADGVLNSQQINDVTEYVLSLTERATDAAAVKRGQPVFAEQCASCHGDKGQGNIELGAPRLSDSIWLYGGDKATILETIYYARNGNMPAWSERLDEATVKMLAIYVHALGGGK